MNPDPPPSERIRVQLNFSAYPLRASLGSLGRKWALLVLMNISLSRAQRFNELLRTTPGMSKRILAMRLRELERDGFIARVERDPKFTRWRLTQKGADVLPVLLTLLHFGWKWSAPEGSPTGSPPSWGVTFDISYTRGSRPGIVTVSGRWAGKRRPSTSPRTRSGTGGPVRSHRPRRPELPSP